MFGVRCCLLIGEKFRIWRQMKRLATVPGDCRQFNPAICHSHDAENCHMSSYAERARRRRDAYAHAHKCPAICNGQCALHDDAASLPASSVCVLLSCRRRRCHFRWTARTGSGTRTNEASLAAWKADKQAGDVTGEGANEWDLDSRWDNTSYTTDTTDSTDTQRTYRWKCSLNREPWLMANTSLSCSLTQHRKFPSQLNRTGESLLILSLSLDKLQFVNSAVLVGSFCNALVRGVNTPYYQHVYLKKCNFVILI